MPTPKLSREFYARSAVDSVKDFLGKVLVHRTAEGIVSGVVYDVEAYPAFVDGVHHGNKRTRRAEVMWGPPGYAYVYLIYGKWFQFAAVVAREGVPDVVFIRAVKPLEGLEVMERQWDRQMSPLELCASPGKLCQSMLITKARYGADLCGPDLYFEDRGIDVAYDRVRIGKRVGISTNRAGHETKLRFYLGAKDVRALGDSSRV
jgi:DNA-3-methyladenine glycosylase